MAATSFDAPTYDFDDSEFDLDRTFADDEFLGSLFASLFSGPAFEQHDAYPEGIRVFDWEKAANRIVETGATEAAAGLSEDWGMTGGPILEGGEIVSEGETYTFLASRWATPVLFLDGREEECWTLLDDSTYDESSYWPSDARRILGS
jgi:hypothetical protein